MNDIDSGRSAQSPFETSIGVLIGERFLTADQIDHRALRLATVLAERGIGKDDMVGLLLRNDFAFLEGYLAATQLGALAVPMNWYWKQNDLDYILRDCGAKVVIAHADLMVNLEPVLPDGVEVIVVDTPPETQITAPTEVAGHYPDYERLLAGARPIPGDPVPSSGVLIYTSGTTGRPKGVQRDAPPGGSEPFASIKPTAAINGLYAGARALVPSPLYHGAPLVYALAALRTGCSVLIMPRFTAESFLKSVEDHTITHAQMVPTMFVRLLKLPDEVRQRYDVSSLQQVGHAAAPCPPAVKKAMIGWWGPIINEYYGCTEVGVPAVSSTSVEWLSHPSSVGRAREGATVVILDTAGNEAPTGTVGEIYARVAGVPDFTYRNNPAAKEAITVNGLYACGDVGYIDEDGFLYITDRSKDMINSGGIKIYSAQVEAALIEMPAIADVAVFGLPDDDYGEKVVAFVEPAEGDSLLAEQVRAWAIDHLPGYSVPRLIEVVDKLPREDSGKLLKRLIRDKLLTQRSLDS